MAQPEVIKEVFERGINEMIELMEADMRMMEESIRLLHQEMGINDDAQENEHSDEFNAEYNRINDYIDNLQSQIDSEG
jgi:hypothetical protein